MRAAVHADILVLENIKAPEVSKIDPIVFCFVFVCCYFNKNKRSSKYSKGSFSECIQQILDETGRIAFMLEHL